MVEIHNKIHLRLNFALMHLLFQISSNFFYMKTYVNLLLHKIDSDAYFLKPLDNDFPTDQQKQSPGGSL